MAWIKVVHEDEASGELAEYYRNAATSPRKRLRVGNVHKAMSLNPKAMQAVDDLQNSWRQDPVLSSLHQEMIAVVTSALNRCYY